MSSRAIVAVGITASLVVGGWALAQHEQRAADAPVQVGGDQYVVSPAGQSAVLLDAKSGMTWVMDWDVEGVPVWLPADRIDSQRDASQWRHRQRDVKEQRGVGRAGAGE